MSTISGADLSHYLSPLRCDQAAPITPCGPEQDQQQRNQDKEKPDHGVATQHNPTTTWEQNLDGHR